MNASGPPIIELDRALATLYGLALGDALGMPSQTLSRTEIQQHYGLIEDFVAPYAGHPVSRGLNAAQVTDDTEQALLLARRLIDNPGTFDAPGWALDLLNWEADVRERGLLDLLGPSSKAALEAIRSGADPGEAARQGTTNGAAMRIAPVGILVSASNLETLVNAVEQTCRVTHNTGEAIAAAAAVATCISARISGSNHDESIALALHAAELGQQRGYPVGAGDIAERIARAVELAGSRITLDSFAEAVGNSVASYEAIPAAFGIMHMADGDTWRTGLLGANIGDDTDTIGAIACAMSGAGAGMEGIPADKLERLKTSNAMDIDSTAADLVSLRNETSMHSYKAVT
jgi:ADP-ribosylglycohydrolase